MPRVPSTVNNATGAIRQRAPSYALAQTGNRQVNDSQRNAQAGTAAARLSPIGDGNLITGVAHTSGASVSFKHLLGRVPSGAFPACIHNAAPVSVAVSAISSSTVSAVASATCTIDWWVY